MSESFSPPPQDKKDTNSDSRFNNLLRKIKTLSLSPAEREAAAVARKEFQRLENATPLPPEDAEKAKFESKKQKYAREAKAKLKEIRQKIADMIPGKVVTYNPDLDEDYVPPAEVLPAKPAVEPVPETSETVQEPEILYGEPFQLDFVGAEKDSPIPMILRRRPRSLTPLEEMQYKDAKELPDGYQRQANGKITTTEEYPRGFEGSVEPVVASFTESDGEQIVDAPMVLKRLNMQADLTAEANVKEMRPSTIVQKHAELQAAGVTVVDKIYATPEDDGLLVSDVGEGGKFVVHDISALVEARDTNRVSKAEVPKWLQDNQDAYIRLTLQEGLRAAQAGYKLNDDAYFFLEPNEASGEVRVVVGDLGLGVKKVESDNAQQICEDWNIAIIEDRIIKKFDLMSSDEIQTVVGELKIA